jgi:hypothetical protein
MMLLTNGEASLELSVHSDGMRVTRQLAGPKRVTGLTPTGAVLSGTPYQVVSVRAGHLSIGRRCACADSSADAPPDTTESNR